MTMLRRKRDVVQTEDSSFYQEARDWENSRVVLLQRSETRAWKVAIASTIMALTGVLAVAMLVPLKSAVPFLIYADKSTGDTKVQVAMDAQPVEFSEILDKHWISEYVVSRERYYWDLLQYDYDRTRAFSGDTPGREYESQFEGPEAVHKVLGRSTEYAVKLISITVQNRKVGAGGIAVVRFERNIRSTGSGGASQTGSISRYVATLSYKYETRRFSKEKSVMMNPMGFTVTAYRVDPELAEVTPSKGSTMFSPLAAQAPSAVSPSSTLPQSSGLEKESGRVHSTNTPRP